MKKRSLILWVGILLLGIGYSYSNSQDTAAAPDYSQRRSRLQNTIREGAALISAQTFSRNQFLENKYFYYLTGADERGAMLLVTAGDNPKSIYFNSRGSWTAAAPLGEMECRPLSALNKAVRALPLDSMPVWLSFADFDLLNRLGNGPNPFMRAKSLVNIDPILENMRVIKSPYELECLERAVNITAEGLCDVFRAAAPGMREYDLAAILEYSFRRSGSPGSTFLQAASGPNSTFIHFGAGDRILQDGDMIVIDVGAEYRHYTADITRTIPAGGRFTPAQKDIYSLVLKAQKAAIEKMIPGEKFDTAQQTAEDVLMAGLHSLGLVTDPQSPWQKSLFIQHGFYHFIGLDIHDIWYSYRRGIENKRMEEGMIITMEPGLYFPADMLDTMSRRLKGKVSEEEYRRFIEKIRPVYDKYHNIGVRIEDDILITSDRNKIVSAKVPKEIQEIEKMMKDTSPHNRLGK